MLDVGLSKITLLCLEKLPLYLGKRYFGKNIFCLFVLFFNFIMNQCWILSNTFTASIEMVMWFLLFLLLMWSITLIDLFILNHPCDPDMNPPGSWGMILFMYYWTQFVNILLKIFKSMLIKYIGLWFYFWVGSLSGFGIRGWWLHRMTLGLFPSHHSFGRVWEGQV